MYTKPARIVMTLAILEAIAAVSLWWSTTDSSFQLFPTDVSYRVVMGFMFIALIAFRLAIYMDVDTMWKAMNSEKRKRKNNEHNIAADGSRLMLDENETVAQDSSEEIEIKLHRRK